MPNTQVQVLNGNAIKLAIQYFQDATGFVAIMQQNWLTDYVINGPVTAVSLANNDMEDTTLVLEPLSGVNIGDLVYCSGLDTYGVVLNVEQIYSVQQGLPFCSCVSPIGPAAQRVLPPSGSLIATNVAITPGLDNAMAIGSEVTFAVGTPSTITIPSSANSRGVPT